MKRQQLGTMDRTCGSKEEGDKQPLVVQLTSEQKALIQECTGQALDALNLEGCGDRLIVSRPGWKCELDSTREKDYVVMDLTSTQINHLRSLTGKTFKQLRIQRRRVS